MPLNPLEQGGKPLRHFRMDRHDPIRADRSGESLQVLDARVSRGVNNRESYPESIKRREQSLTGIVFEIPRPHQPHRTGPRKHPDLSNSRVIEDRKLITQRLGLLDSSSA